MILILCGSFSLKAEKETLANKKAPYTFKVKETIKHISCVLNGVSSNDGAIDLLVKNYSGTLRFEWSTNDGSGLNPSAQNQKNLSEGRYTVKIYENGNRIFKKTYAVCKYPNFDVSVSKTDNYCYNAAEGTISIDASGGNPPYAFSIDGGQSFQNDPDFEQLKKGTYHVVVKDNRLCVYEEDIKISQGAYFSVHHPGDLTIDSCLSQEEVNTQFAEWLDLFHYNGGTKPVVEEFKNDVAPNSCGGSVTVTYIATDDCNVRKECSATFTVTPPEPISLDTEAQNTSTECDRDSESVFQDWLTNNGYAEVTGSCNNLTWSNNYNECVWQTICGNTKYIEVTFKITNGCEKVKTKARFTIEDTQAPMFVEALPQDVTLNCSEIPQPETLTATDNCDTNIEVVFSEETNQNDCGTASIIRTWTATDCSNNSISHIQTITIQDTQAPIFVEALPQDATLNCSEIPQPETITATDNCDTNIEVVFSEETNQNDCGTASIIRTWTATDCSNNSISHSQTITIEDTQAPIFVEALPQDVTLICSDIPQPETLTATDNCDTNIKVVFSEETNQNDCGTASIIRTWTATDCSNNSISHTQNITIEDNQTPMFVEALPQDVTLNCSNIPQPETLTATDNCDTNIEVVFTEENNQNDCGTASIIRSWTATDCSNNSISHIQTITIEDNQPPMFVEALPQDVTLSCSDIPQPETLTATDNCDTNVEVVFSEETNQNDCGTASIIRTWTATDCSNNSISHSQTITIEDNQPPMFVEALPQDVTLSCSDIPQPETLTATDNCDTNVEVVFSEETNQNDCGTASIIRTWTATDCSNNSISHSQTITIEDTQSPMFVEALPQDISASCGEIPIAATLTAIDNCGNAIPVVFSEENTGDDCNRIIKRTWSVVDCYNNSSSHTQTIMIQDIEKPELISDLDTEITVFNNNIPEIPNLNFQDNCDPDVTISFEEISNFISEVENYEITRTWTVTDNCGNESIFIQTIFVRPMPSPAPPPSIDPVRVCVEDAVLDLQTFIPETYSTDGSWEVVLGNTSVNQGIFNPNSSALGFYEIVYTPTEANRFEISINIEVHDECVVLPCNSIENIMISKTITPNGDAYNEFFTVSGLDECGFKMMLEVFNRWGNIVYKSNDYQNDWNGYSNTGIGNANLIPTGTYFYVLTLIDSGFDPIKGYFYAGTSSK
ncbi:gliding motility-associated C-terminal domain-containing protein [Galbibacter sp. BG1]|uniref:HYR-like domain-containing protein n=1 Tax=Galbibacter sp. BG1 TaxID=1170699 RepID=UPI001C700EFA|nr:gliding motility-associated C-terminal domain-containing protein [Galbibacter sp. BG1]